MPTRNRRFIKMCRRKPECRHKSLADTLTDAFVEAYDLVKKLRLGDEPKKTVTLRPAQPRIQVLRPDGSARMLR